MHFFSHIKLYKKERRQEHVKKEEMDIHILVTEKLDILADGKRNKINQHDREKGDDDGAR